LTGIATVVLAGVLWSAGRGWAQPLPTAVATGAALLGALPVIAPRPQIASLILLGIAAIAWRRTATDLKPRWWLVPLSWVWACTHGFWFVGTFLGFAVVVGLMLDRRVTFASGRSLALVPLLSVLAASMTPAGPKLLVAPFMVGGIAEHIQEWQPPDFQSPFVLVVAMMAAVVVLTAARGKPAPWTDLLPLLLAAMMLVYAARTVAVAAVILVPLTASSIQAWLSSSTSTSPVASTRSRGERLLVRLGFAAAVGSVLGVVLANKPYDDPYPDMVDETLASLPGDAVVYNEYFYGGWMSWRHPDLVHGIDGMTEAYPPEYLSDYLDAGRLNRGWERFLNRIGATHAFLPSDDAMALELQRHMDWKEKPNP
jgi:hypothetical protein